MSKSFTFYIRGMTCGGCSLIIENLLKDAYNTEMELFSTDVTAEDPKKTTVILTDNDNKEHRILWDEIKNRIEEVGYNCESYEFVPPQEQINSETAAETIPTPEPTGIQKFFTDLLNIITSHWFLGALGCGAGIALLIATLALGGLPLAAMIPIAGLSMLLTLALGAKSLKEAWNKLEKANTLTMDSLFAISTLSVLGVSLASFCALVAHDV